MGKLLTYFESKPRWLILTICLLFVASIGMLDYVTGDLSLLIFYIIPIFLAVWLLDRTDGLFITLLCGAELCIIDRLLAPSDIPLVSIRTWNSIIETLLLIFVSYILASLKNELEQNEKRADDLENANLELDAFNYSVAHDLRKPLTNINGYSQLIMELYGGEMDQKCRGYLSEIYDGTLRMNQLIDALLKFSRLAQSEMCMETINLSDIAKTIAAELQLTELDRNVEVHIAEGISTTGDPQLLRIVLENLIGNAWKYTAKNADTVISFGRTLSRGKEIYYVRDNGVGFDGKQADKLFIPFQRLHSAEEFAGFGIGLATVQRIIQRHGGRVWAEGEPGKGATVYFMFGNAITT